MSFLTSRKWPACLAANAAFFFAIAAAIATSAIGNLTLLEAATLLLLVNALVVVIVGAVLILPALVQSPGDEKKLESLLARQTAIPHEVRRAVLFDLREDNDRFRRRAHVGRMTVVAGGVFLVLAFGSATAAITRAQPLDSILTNDGGPVINRTITAAEAWRFTGDQVSGALFLDVPELYHWYLTDLVNNRKAPAYTTFTFAFRAVLGWVSLATMITLARSLRLRRRAPAKQKHASPAEPPIQAVAAAASGFEVASRSMAE